MIAGNKFAIAVPDVVNITTGFNIFFAIPSAKNAFDLSSKWLKHLILWCSKKEVTNGVFLEPGEMHAWFTPFLYRSSTILFDQKVCF